MQALTISLVQGDTRWHDRDANHRYYAERVRAAAGSELIVLPETFSTGFTNDTAQHAERRGESLALLRDLARETGAVIAGSVITHEQVGEVTRHSNRLLWVQPDGRHAFYDKRHLFRMAGEHRHFDGGTQRVVVELKGWRILLQVCYDLRFPVWSRNRHDDSALGGMDYDAVLYVANWPAARRHAWRTLLRARAIENLSYAIGVNRVGTDGNALRYGGDSAVIDPLGEPLVELGEDAATATVTLQAQALLEHRERFPAWRDADAFVLKP